MQKSQVGDFLIAAVIVFVLLIVLSLFLALTLRADAPSFLEMAINLLLRLIGLTTVVFSLMKLLTEGLVSFELEKFSKWIVLVLLGLLIIQPKGFLSLGLASLLIAMLIVARLKPSGGIAESGQ